MSRTVALRFAPREGTRAGVTRAGAVEVVADRPAGRAGGQGQGANGAELLAAALGGCFWNDLHYAAEARGLALDVLGVEAAVTLDGEPPRVTAAAIRTRLAGTGARACFEAACADSTIANSIVAAFPVTFDLEET